MFQWFSKSEKNAIATIYSTNITINKPGVDILANSYAVMLGLDESNYKIALHPISQDDYESKNIQKITCLFSLVENHMSEYPLQILYQRLGIL